MQTVTHSDALSRFGCALSDPTRAEILLMLRDAPDYPSELADRIGVSRQILSNHLACLRGCGLVVAVPLGRRTRYELADRRIGHALDDLVDGNQVVGLKVAPSIRSRDFPNRLLRAATPTSQQVFGYLETTFSSHFRALNRVSFGSPPIRLTGCSDSSIPPPSEPKTSAPRS